jgi:hypothetical protein
MIAKNLDSPLERSKAAWQFVRDGYRAIRGKGPKHTLSLHASVATSSPAPIATAPLPPSVPCRPTLDLEAYSVTEHEWELLAEMLQQSAQYAGPIVEVGVLAGRTTQRLAVLKAPTQKIIAVDNFCWNGWGLTPEEQWGLVKHSLAYLVQAGHVEICRIDKNKFYREYDGPPPAMVFLDAMHDYEETKKDILWARRVGAKIICGHDYKEQFPGVIQIVDEMGGPRLLRGSVFVLHDAA